MARRCSCENVCYQMCSCGVKEPWWGKVFFSGTTQKSKACNKVVHFVEMLSADGVPYHKTSFRCSKCNGKLAISGYSTLDGVLYCKPHFEQKFKESGRLSRKPSIPRSSEGKTSKVSYMLSGTQDKCAVCKKTVYPLEKVIVEGDFLL